MAKSFTQYWQNETWRNSSNERVVDHSAGNDFRRRGVKVGDHVYVVTNMAGRMYVAGKMSVAAITDQRTAERKLGRKLWKADEHLIGQGTSMRFDREVPLPIVKQLRF